MMFSSAYSLQTSYEQELEQKLRGGGIPGHIAIIMDGNRRWAKAHHLPPKVGHWRGAETLECMTEVASSIGVETLTVYSFSTENWNRSEEEISALFELFEKYLTEQKKRMIQKGVRLGYIGDISPFPQSLKDLLLEVQEATKNGRALSLVLALNYGGRDDITRAMRRIAFEVEEGRLSSKDIEESTIEKYLDTSPYGNPDLLIRTSGELRMSNFLLWQISYTELYVSQKMWPEFTKIDFFHALEAYQNRDRRLGG